MDNNSGFGIFEFLCPYCQEVFLEPVLTPCLHRFCYNCFVTIVLQFKKCLICDRPLRTKRDYRLDFYFMSKYTEFMKKRNEEAKIERAAKKTKLLEKGDNDMPGKTKKAKIVDEREADNRQASTPKFDHENSLDVTNKHELKNENMFSKSLKIIIDKEIVKLTKNESNDLKFKITVSNIPQNTDQFFKDDSVQVNRDHCDYSLAADNPTIGDTSNIPQNADQFFNGDSLEDDDFLHDEDDDDDDDDDEEEEEGEEEIVDDSGFKHEWVYNFDQNSQDYFFDEEDSDDSDDTWDTDDPLYND